MWGNRRESMRKTEENLTYMYGATDTTLNALI